jgi:copper chaperone
MIMKVELELDGMSCNHCKMAVDQALEEVDGVADKSVEIGRAVIYTEDWDALHSKLADLLEEEGYPITSVNTTT